ncbi:MAG: hypothetical protein WC867_03440 [Candidatus Pacearchaeota archaeon]|jgi:hypothetical protein
MDKRGQLSVFIIIGIIVFISLIIFLVLKNNSNKNNEITNPINQRINECIDITFKEGIRYILFQGGYYEAPKESVNFMMFSIPYYFKEGETKVPDKKTIENELSKYIIKELPKCLNFSHYENQGYKFEKKEIILKTTLGKESILKINYPITVSKDNKNILIKDFSYSNPLDFEKIDNIINQFALEHQKNPDHIPIGYLSLIANEKEFLYNINYITENELVYSFIFPEILGKNNTIIYNFGAKYKWIDIIPTYNESSLISFENAPLLNAYTNKKFSYQVKANGSNIRFEDYTGLFDIDENSGKIEFTPGPEDSGEHEILIKAIDNKGNEEIFILYINIEKTIETGFNLTST